MSNLPALLHPEEVASLFGVHVRTLSRWADKGLLKFFTTPGGHRRYYESSVMELLQNGVTTTEENDGHA